MAAESTSDSQPAARGLGDVEVVFAFERQMPTGVAVADDGRRFVCYPRWGDDVAFTVAELREGKEAPYPGSEINAFDPSRPSETLVSVQSVVIDPAGRLWLLDTGSIEMQPVLSGAPKLVQVDLEHDQVARTIVVPPDVALETTYLNDVRFDLSRGEAGLAFITDSGTQPSHPMGLIVVDLASGRAWRRLSGHPSVKPDPDHLAVIHGQPIEGLLMGSDGIAISADASRLYYCPLASRHLYSVDAALLADSDASDDQVAATVQDHGEKGGSDGLETDDGGRIYATNYEHGAILRTSDAGESWEAVAHRPDMLFVDTLAVATDRHLYFTVNQLHLQPQYQGGKDLRKPPYALMRVAIDAGPVRRRS